MAIENDLKLLYCEKVQILYSVVGLTGFGKLIFYRNPYIGLADIEFNPGGVTVKTVDFDEFEEVKITVYQGIPNNNALFPQYYVSSGIIGVSDEGLAVDAGSRREAVFPWPSGLTDVLVALDAQEVISRQVRTITFYAEPYKERVRKKYLKLFLRKENE